MSQASEPGRLLRVLHVGVGNRGLWPLEMMLRSISTGRACTRAELEAG